MASKEPKATFPTSHTIETGTKPEEKLLRTIFGKNSKPETMAERTDTAALGDQFDPDFKILDEIMDRDAEALRALAK